ncbi:MAG: MCP four helix bundle domain-containing protein [Rhodospirillum sp.]|nr:MCP four helix bundle domain-containing protein [Rhodospirillum sp.]MCF8488836.1 MCP four helix bundle domain-containing protein [Rhodospirillum sp.]MCF8501329.1 MCP four helix bundle domain-containing protein [Rhodospirillum sp.]
MRNVTIRVKLIVAFSLLIVLTVGLGLFAVNRISVVNDASTEIAQNWLPSVRAVGALNTTTSDFRIEEGRHVMSTNAAIMEQAEVALKEQGTLLENEIKAYDKLISSEKERAMFVEFQEQWADYLNLNKKLIALSRGNQNEEAARMFRENSKTVFVAASKTLTDLIDLNDRSAALASEAGDRIYFLARGLIIALLVVSVLLGAGAAWYIIRTVSGSIQAMTGAMGQLAAGDTETEIPGTDRGDEIGAMSKAVEVFKENMIRAIEAKIKEDAEIETQRKRAAALEALTGGFDVDVSVILKSLAMAGSSLQGTATSMTATAEQTSRQSLAVASASDQASANVQTVATAAEELSASITEITRQVSKSTQIAETAVSETERTNQQVRGLAEAAQKIGDVVNIINDIASQTNLLALNATIEAARAGDAGKGFAVVASEVKSLANETAKATDQITSQISGIQQATKDAVEAIGGISHVIGQINEISTSIASAMEEQGAATQEIARNVQQAAVGTQDVSSNIGDVTQAVSSTGEAAKDVLSAVGEMSRETDDLRSKVEAFLTNVRSA